MKKIILLGFCLILPTAFAQTAFDLDLGNCEPKNLFVRAKVMLDPRGFWVDQYVEIGSLLTSGFDFFSPCVGRRGEDRQRCITLQSTRLDGLNRCFVHTAEMCRLHGGFCDSKLSDFN
jgi:hypothetical protein